MGTGAVPAKAELQKNIFLVRKMHSQNNWQLKRLNKQTHSRQGFLQAQNTIICSNPNKA